jgi:calcium-dependent protein kinase
MGFCISKEPKPLSLYPKSISLSEGTISSIRRKSTLYADIQLTYEFKKVLGHGQFGTVREAYSLKTQQTVAIKSISKDKVGANLQQLRRELEIMRLIDHPNVIQYFEAYEDEKYFHIVMELCTGKDLFDKLTSLGSLSESCAVDIMKSLLLAVSHLHSLGICHRDLKPENFLFENNQPNALIKIIDFGLSIKQNSLADMSSLVGTPYFLAPEVLKGKYSPLCDVWSLGVVLYFLLSGKPPFEGDTINDIFSAISTARLDFEDSIWSNISHTAKNLILQMLTKRPSDRISIAEALNHPWLQQQKGENAPTIAPSVLMSLKQHKSPKKLQRKVMKVMLKFLSTEEIEELRQAFLDLDQENSGFLTVSSLEKAMEMAGFHLQLEEIRSKS